MTPRTELTIGVAAVVLFTVARGVLRITAEVLELLEEGTADALTRGRRG